MKRLLLGITLVLVLALLLPSAALAHPPGQSETPGEPGQGDENAPPVYLQFVAFNDFHGNIVHSRVIDGIPAGGADYLAAHIRELEAANPNTVVISAGDLIGASPLISALFHDEPTIEAANLMGVDFATVGNHEFDEGWQELLRMQYGGCHPVDGCQDGDGFDGADFEFLAANVIVDDTGETLFPPYAVQTFDGVRVGFIGVVLEGTPSIVSAGGVEGLTFIDEADAINAAVEELRQRQVEFIVVIIHEGVSVTIAGLSDCVNPSGNLIDIVDRTDDEVDLFISGHTHANFVCTFDGRTTTAAWYYGRLYTKIDVELNRVTKEMTVLYAENFPNWQNITPAADVTAVIDKYDELSAELANQVIGSITADITRTANAAGESALGDVIADAQLWATAPPGYGDAVVAFMNPGGIRADLLYAPDGSVTYGEAFNVQPFSNNLVTMTLTGAQIEALLEQQFVVNRILQVSDGFSYSYSASGPVGDKIDPTSIMIGGVPIDLGAPYRVTVNNFLAGGGDGFTVLTQGTDLLTGGIDLDAFVLYFGASSPVAPGPQTRITQLP